MVYKMIDKIIIKPFVGIEGLSLGTTKSEVVDILGVPDESSVREFKDESFDENWEYFELGLELTFSSDDNWLLGTIGVTSELAELAGHHIIGLNENKLLETLEQIGIMPTVLEDDLTDLGSRDYACDKYGLSFWVQNGIVTSIAIFPDHGESGDIPLWPNRE